MKRAAIVLIPKIKKYKLNEVTNILNSDFPTDYPITDTKMPSLSLACSLSDDTEAHHQMNRKLLEAIFEQSPDINCKDSFERTPLHHACNSGNLTAVCMLLEHSLYKPNPKLNGQKLEINAVTIGGETPLLKAAG